LLFVINEAIRRFQMSPPETRVVVQGSGNVGGIAARLLHEAGYKVVAISDIHGGIYNPEGVNIPEALDHLQATRSFEGYPGVEAVANQELLELECDVLVPAATENQITSQNADRLKCKVLAEGANGPTTPEADPLLKARGVLVVPDILANAGGVTVSYFEWVQDLQSFFWNEPEIDARLERILSRAFDAVWECAEQHGTDLRMGALVLAVGRVAEATMLRGVYP
jgi:glutamate dehydrogenase (NAD(P)+)